MKTSVKRLIFVSIGYLVSAGIGTGLAVVNNLPADFGGFLRGKNVWADFITQTGTALSPPAFLLVLQIIFIALAFRRDRRQKIGIAGLAVLGVIYTFGQLGEALTWRVLSPSGFNLAEGLVVAANLILPIGMVVFGSLAWMRRSREIDPGLF